MRQITRQTGQKTFRNILFTACAVLFVLAAWISSAVSEETQTLADIAPKEAYELIQTHLEDENFTILDVRTPNEFETGHLEGAININFYADNFREAMDTLDKTKVYLVYCRSGNRSGRTLKLMEELQFTTAYNMLGGIGRWIQEELPITQAE